MRGLVFLLGSWLVAGGCSSSPPAPPADSGEPATGASSAVAPRWPAWGEPPRSLADEALHRELLAAELDRDPNAPALASALSSRDPAAVTRAAWSLARIGGPAAAEHFVGWLSDGQPRPPGTLAAIAALEPPRAAEGLSDPAGIWAELEERLWQRYAVTEVPASAAELLLAIARVGGSISQARLAVDLAVAPSDDAGERYVRGMDAVAILCRRGYPLPAQGVDAIARGLTSGPLSRRAAAVALERCAGPSAEQLAGPVRAPLARVLATRVSEAADDQDAHAAWAALGALGELPSQIPADVLGVRPRHFTVEVAAVRALAANTDGRPELARRLAAIDLSTVAGSRWHAVLEALRSIRPALDGTPELLDALAPMQPAVEVALKGAAARDRKALVLVRCELLALAAIRSGELDTLEHCADGEAGISDTHGVRLAIESLLRVGAALSREQKVGALLAHATDPRADVAAAALSALAEIDDPRVESTLKEALKGDDVGIVSAAAASIAARAVDRQRRDPDAAAALGAAIARLGNDRAVEARIAAIEALGNLARSAAPAVVEKSAAIASGSAPALAPVWLERDVLPLASDPNQGVRAAARRALSEDAALLERFDAAVPKAFPQAFVPAVHAALDANREVRALKVHTDAGSFTIDLRGTPAPIAQANLVALAAAEFFEGLTFHRVVPDFVIQGGDPRGDGYGGPGHVMPCEWSNLRYERGTVGIALAGKDTGGSQIFVSHGRPVHLDARYTVIGRVTDGLEVVDAILPYDAISRVEMLEDPAS